MEKAQRQKQSVACLTEKSKREQHNQRLAHGLYWHGLFRWFGIARPKIQKIKHP